ncbi:MAG: FlgD immunoglobulin-like domain containing protein [Candidatus Krumholzibacteria bacterium]|nr:FlgD immunoglobulin-like domain containing protein [Candidatus Krumholzibacteria bacterium]
MKPARLITCWGLLSLFLLQAAAAFGAAEPRQLMDAARAQEAVLHGGSSQGIKSAKALGDTLVLVGPWGSGAVWNGQFEDAAGEPSWGAWTAEDQTERQVNHWQINAADPGLPGALSAWCGDASLLPCDAADPTGGYGNNWHEVIEYRLAIGNADSSTVVQVEGDLQYSLEAGYDWLGLAVWRDGEYVPTVVRTWDDIGSTVANESVTYLPGEYRHDNQIVVQLQVFTDAAFSDEDCRFATTGAARLDNLTVTVTNAGQQTVSVTDFQGGTYGDWSVVPPVAVGNFAHTRLQLRDQDPCRQNSTPQLAFVDDGLIVPGTGGSPCQNYCYGPGGFTVNTRGGLLGPDADLDNVVYSPLMIWPDDSWDGCQIAFDWYLHELANGASGPIYVQWAVRSTASADSADIETAPWADRNWSYSGSGTYTRYADDVSDLIVPSPRFVQFRLRAYEPVGWWFGEGNDSTPAPYFDNVRISAFRKQGPAMAARTVDLANDGFPASGLLDAANPGANSVRFDMAADIAPDLHLRNDPGDSIVVSLKTTRAGAGLSGAPTLHYRLLPNPLFDPWRTSGMPNEGQVPTVTPLVLGVPFSGKVAFDLPDSGFLFPGDVLRYFIAATDEVEGVMATTILPADTTGFSIPTAVDPLAYVPEFTMRALPSVRPDPVVPDSFVAPGLLVWNDDGSALGWTRWVQALTQLGLTLGTDYDIFATAGAANGAGNGLGGRATTDQLALYNVMAYTSGTQSNFTLSDGDLFADPSDDLALLQSWLDLGGRNLFLTGDNLAADLAASGGVSLEFMLDVMGVGLHSWTLRPLIGNQAAPEVVALPGNSVVPDAAHWLAFGSCDYLNNFDAVMPVGAALPLAEFTNFTGQTGSYAWSAATLNLLPANSGRVVSLPYDLQFVVSAPESGKASAPLTARARLLGDVLTFLGYDLGAGSGPTDVPLTRQFSVSNYPNPFNPRTTINYHLPRSGHLTLKIFDLRGHCIRTLIDTPMPAGPGQILWQGQNDQGTPAASGTYFYQAHYENQKQTAKMLLLK